MELLVDMDQVLADFEGSFLREFRKKYPDSPYIPLENRNTHWLQHQYPEESESAIVEIITEKGFFRGLEPIPGGTEALKTLQREDHDVNLCTSFVCADGKGYTFATEKYDWVEKHLGKDWTEKLIIAKDKTRIGGDILIDDAPEINGKQTPSWEHVIYDQPFNRHINSKRRLTWDNYREVLRI